MPDSLKIKTIKGISWSAIESFSLQGIQFLITLVIARLLTPEDFGLVGMLTIFISVSQSLINSGFSQALIRKQNRTESDCSTVFFFNIVISFVLYVLLYSFAPLVALFFHEPSLTPLMRVLCVVVVINSFAVVQRAILTAVIDFRTLAKATLTASIMSGALGIYLANTGFGVWTLVWQQIVNAFICVVLLWLFSSWRPKWLYSWKSFREMFSFGSKLLVSGLLETVYNNLYQLVVGKVFTAATLGHYTQAKHFSNLPSTHITGIVQRVTYPVLSSIQDDDNRLSVNYRKLLRLSAFIIFPIMCLIAGIANPLVLAILGEKWSFTALLIPPLCFTMMWFPIHSINLNLLQVKGRSDLFLKIEIIKKIIGVLILFISIPFGIVFLCWSGVLSSIISLIINTYYTGKIINIGFVKQMTDLLGTLIVSLIIFVVVHVESILIASNYVSIVVGVLTSALLYFSVSWIFKFSEIDYLKNIRK
jgi:O-antigen/teichoic acid export membrane protein